MLAVVVLQPGSLAAALSRADGLLPQQPDLLGGVGSASEVGDVDASAGDDELEDRLLSSASGFRPPRRAIDVPVVLANQSAALDAPASGGGPHSATRAAANAHAALAALAIIHHSRTALAAVRRSIPATSRPVAVAHTRAASSTNPDSMHQP